MKFLQFLIILSLFFVAACNPSYMAGHTNVPLLYNQKDLNAGLYLTTAGLELQGAYAVADHLGVMANFMGGSFTDDRYFLGEGGVGYYTPIGRNERAHFEVFGGAGYGYGSAKSTTTIGNSTTYGFERGKYTKLFIQPDFGIHRKAFEWALAARFSYINYLSFETDGNSNAGSPSALMIEPTMTFRFGFGGNGFFENKKLSLQFGLYGPLGGDAGFESGVLQFGLGIIYRNRKYNTGAVK